MAWPVLEIVLFVVIGGRIGFWAVLGIILATALLGGLLISRQNMRALTQLRGGAAQLFAPDLANGMMVMISGILLILPGFVSDIMGLALLIPFVRRGIFRTILPQTPHAHAPDDIIDAEYEDVTHQSRH
jgi:UPF0716 protein FxsA